MKRYLKIILTGAIIGAISVGLVALGNPGNMGFCIACFLRDITGALSLHKAEVVQNVRPEILGLVLGACIMAFVGKEFKPKGGSSPVTRFVLGCFVMIGALMFLGCPLRMMLRIAGGDLNAVIGLIGFVVGIGIGIFILQKGFTLKRSYAQSYVEGEVFPVAMGVLLIMVLTIPGAFIWSQKGPGAAAAPIIASLIAGLVVGALAQKTRFCTVGSIRDALMFKDFYLLTGFITLIIVAAIGNMILGQFHLGFVEQPIAHTDGVWNFLGMLLVGWGSVLLGGCPLRQLILSGEGNTDSVVTVLGLMAGAAFAHNFGLASSGNGPTLNGQIAVGVGIIVVTIISIGNISRVKN